MMKKKLCEYFSDENKNKCYGCSVCENVCPTESISMQYGNDGFCYPVLNKNNCIECGLCKKSCIYHISLKKNNHKLYAVQNSDLDVLKYCQSGGAFDAFSDYFLEIGGVVYGAIIDQDLNVRHDRAESKQQRNKMRMSKYTNSYIADEVLDKIGYDIASNKPILFSGTPCQCAMVRLRFGEYKGLYTMEFICHGVPSQQLFREYIRLFEKENGTKIVKVVFRVPFWEAKGLNTMMLTDENGKKYLDLDYAALFYSHLGHRESCFDCIFANKNRQSDITIGGFLDKELFIQPDNKYSMSMCIINTEKGDELWDQIKHKVFFQEVPYGSEFKQQPCLYHPVQCPKNYDAFWETYYRCGLRQAMEKYISKDIYSRYHLEDEV